MLDKNKLTNIERDLVKGLKTFAKDLKAGEPIPKKYTCRRWRKGVGDSAQTRSPRPQ